MKGINGRIDVKFENNTQKFNYNRNDVIFQSKIINMTE